LGYRLDILYNQNFKEVKQTLLSALENYGDLLPVARDSIILVKPNLNSNMNALTGNTTDLRLLSAIIQFLKDEGYSNIVIGEGTNSGFYRNRIGVISRLKVDELARHFGVMVKDLNYSRPYEIEFAGGIKAQVAGECVDADLFINLPKLKTHFEMGMSVCLKNLMGCLIGQENKKKTHQNLAENILRINEGLKPHLHIVDGLVAMEGLGPTRGTPVRMDTILIGTDPYLIDLACSEIAGFDYRQIKTLKLAEQRGLLTPGHHRFVDSLNLTNIQKSFKPPKAGPLATFVHSPGRQKYFLKVRNTRFFSYLASTHWFGRLLFLSGLRQDVFLQNEMKLEGIHFREEDCDMCNICSALCPLGLDLPGYLKSRDDRCIYCLYCYSACPRKAIEVVGELGFFEEQVKQYDDSIRKLYL